MIAPALRKIEKALEAQIIEHERHGSPIDISVLRAVRRQINAQAEMLEMGLAE